MVKLLLTYSLAQSLSDRSFTTSSILKATLLAALTWWACGFSMWLWNRQFQTRLRHHVLCTFASLVTLIAVFLFQCLGELKAHAVHNLKTWQQEYLGDQRFQWLTFVQVSENLRQLYGMHGWDWDVQEYPDPPRDAPLDASKYRVPLDRPEAREASLRIYADRTVEHLTNQEPVLSRILWKNTLMPLENLRADLTNFQQKNPGRWYNFSAGSMRIAGRLCVEKLEKEVAHQVLVLRSALVATFLTAQLIAFGTAAYSAYSELKTNH